MKFLASLFLTLLSTIFALFCLEMAVRFLNLDKSNLPEWSDRSKQYYYHESASTAQDWSHSAEKPQGTFRIAVIGDSFTFSPYMQADDAFPKRLERWLNLNNVSLANANEKFSKVEVVNYGVPRYSTSHEIATTEQAIKEGADLILLQITLNDPEIKPYRPTGLIKSDRFGQSVPDNFWFRNSRALFLVAQRLANAKSTQSYKDYFFDLWNSKKTFGQFSSSLAKINKLAKSNNVPIFSVVFPLFGFPNDDKYPFHPIHEKAHVELNKLDIPFLDLFSDFKGIPLDRLVVLPGRDRHPNEIANRIATESILSWLGKDRSTGLVPEYFLPKKITKNRISQRFVEN